MVVGGGSELEGGALVEVVVEEVVEEDELLSVGVGVSVGVGDELLSSAAELCASSSVPES